VVEVLDQNLSPPQINNLGLWIKKKVLGFLGR
jgi:hypothetical protein